MSYREEGPTLMANRPANEDVISNPNRRMSSDSAALKTQDRNLVIATWNVRTLHQAGKLDNGIQEMKNMKIDILGVVETRWTENGKIRKDSHTTLYSGGQEHRNGVGIPKKNNTARSIMGYWPISNRAIMVKLQGTPFNINILQTHALTQDHDDEDTEQFYEEIQQATNQAKSDKIICMMGDMNAKVGSISHSNIIGNFGLGDKNYTGERLIQFCEQNQLMIRNTWFQQPPQKLYTWKSLGDTARNQIDCIMINQRFRNSIKLAKTPPEADINSDHNPVKVKMKVKLKQMKKKKAREKLDLDLIKQQEYKDKYNIEMRNKYEEYQKTEMVISYLAKKK